MAMSALQFVAKQFEEAQEGIFIRFINIASLHINSGNSHRSGIGCLLLALPRFVFFCEFFL